MQGCLGVVDGRPVDEQGRAAPDSSLARVGPVFVDLGLDVDGGEAAAQGGGARSHLFGQTQQGALVPGTAMADQGALHRREGTLQPRALGQRHRAPRAGRASPRAQHHPVMLEFSGDLCGPLPQG